MVQIVVNQSSNIGQAGTGHQLVLILNISSILTGYQVVDKFLKAFTVFTPILPDLCSF